MKKTVWPIITIFIILIINWQAANLFDSHFLDWSFFTGLAVTIFIGFFNSSGGMVSDLVDSKLQSNENDALQMEVWTKLDRQKHRIHLTPSLYVALGYTIITGISTLIYYKDYLFN